MVLSILILPELGTVAITDEKQIINKALNTQDWGITIEVEGWWFGYRVIIATIVNESVTGDYIIKITTNTSRIIVGSELRYHLSNLTLDEPEYPIIPHLKSLIGFGPATINITINVILTDPVEEEFLFEEETQGFVLFFYVFCSKTTFNIP